MLSRAVLLSAQRPLTGALVRSMTTDTSSTNNRPVRLEIPSKVRMGFIPEEWFQFFYNKTGVTGPYTFGAGLLTYIFSKELYVMEHEFYNGVAMAALIIYGLKKLGPLISKHLDNELDQMEEEWNAGRKDTIQSLKDSIEGEKKEQWRSEGILMLMDAKKENVNLQLEAAFRERVMNVYNEVKRRLDYQVERRHVERRLSQKHMVNWVINNVLSSITPQQEKDTLNKCIADLGALAARSK